MTDRFAIFSPASLQAGDASNPKNELHMRKGRVKWFDATKGYGYIEDEKGEEVFVHFTAIQEERFRTLESGSLVLFASVKGEKGPKAVRVVKISEGEVDASPRTNRGDGTPP